MLALVAAALVAAGCGAEREASEAPAPAIPDERVPPRQAAAPPRQAATHPPAAPRSTAAACRRDERLGDGRVAYAADVLRPTTAFARPGAGPIAAFGLRNVNGVRTVFSVRAVRRSAGCEPAWYRVQLPLRPNGRTGWVRAADVAVRPVRMRIVVDLSDRRVTLLRDGRPLFVTAGAIGTSATPTPTGRYYVNQRLRAPDPTGPFGPGAVGISAFSPTLQNWAQGGPIAIHGTNTPAEIGTAVSHGCVRIHNDDLERLYGLAVEGTPVEIRL